MDLHNSTMESSSASASVAAQRTEWGAKGKKAEEEARRANATALERVAAWEELVQQMTSSATCRIPN